MCSSPSLFGSHKTACVTQSKDTDKRRKCQASLLGLEHLKTFLQPRYNLHRSRVVQVSISNADIPKKQIQPSKRHPVKLEASRFFPLQNNKHYLLLLLFNPRHSSILMRWQRRLSSHIDLLGVSNHWGSRDFFLLGPFPEPSGESLHHQHQAFLLSIDADLIKSWLSE